MRWILLRQLQSVSELTVAATWPGF
jgi:hypothetical protein